TGGVTFTLTGNVAVDLNNDHNFTSGEPGVQNVMLHLFKKDTAGAYSISVGSRITNASGFYDYGARTFGEYMLQIDVPAAYTANSSNPRFFTIDQNSKI